MGAVKSSPGLSEPDQLTSRYGGVPIVYVESEEDNYVYGECWFKERLSKIEFKPASVRCGSNGCTAVIDSVAMERQSGNPAWGIVDRDTVMARNCWGLVHETDDNTYKSAQPFGTKIKVLCRWELESYLADVEALEHIKANLQMASERPLAAVTQELLDHCCVLVPHAAINAVLHYHRVSGLGDGYTNRFATKEDVEADILLTQIPRLPGSGQEEYETNLPCVLAFDSPDDTVEERFISLLRRIHGKALLERFRAGHNIQIDMKGLLANRIKEQSRIPEEIEKFVEYVVDNPG